MCGTARIGTLALVLSFQALIAPVGCNATASAPRTEPRPANAPTSAASAAPAAPRASSVPAVGKAPAPHLDPEAVSARPPEQPLDYETALALAREALERLDLFDAQRFVTVAGGLRPNELEVDVVRARLQLEQGMLHWASPALAGAAAQLPHGDARARVLADLALAEERRGHAAEAQAALARARAEAASAAFREVLDARTTCPARVDRRVRGGRAFASWREALVALDPDRAAWDGKTENAAEAALVSSGCGQAAVCLASSGGDRWHLAIPRRDGPILIADVAWSQPFRCGGAFGADVKVAGELALVRLQTTYGEVVGVPEGGLACGASGPNRAVDIVVHLVRGEVVLVVDRMSLPETPIAPLAVDARGITLPAPGCGARFAFAR